MKRSFAFFALVCAILFGCAATAGAQSKALKKDVKKRVKELTKEGWKPLASSSTLEYAFSKYRTPLILLGFYYVIGFVPIAFGIDIDIISNITITVGAITKTMIVLCLWNMPKVLPEAWNKSNFHISNGALKALCVVDLLVIVVSGVTSSFKLPLPLLMANLGVVAFAFLFGSIRFRSGKVQVEESYELS